MEHPTNLEEKIDPTTKKHSQFLFDHFNFGFSDVVKGPIPGFCSFGWLGPGLQPCGLICCQYWGPAEVAGRNLPCRETKMSWLFLFIFRYFDAHLVFAVFWGDVFVCLFFHPGVFLVCLDLSIFRPPIPMPKTVMCLALGWQLSGQGESSRKQQMWMIRCIDGLYYILFLV